MFSQILICGYFAKLSLVFGLQQFYSPQIKALSKAVLSSVAVQSNPEVWANRAIHVIQSLRLCKYM